MPNETTRLSFDRLAESFDDQRSLPPAAVSALHGMFAELVDAGFERLIESGAGTGRIAIPALAAGCRVTALDISAPMLDAFRVRLAALPEVRDRCDLQVGDARQLPLEADSFDLGVLAQVLYLVPDWSRVLDELVRVVRPDGRVLLVQERTTMSPELDQWDRTWRDATAQAGHVAIPQEPDDEAAVEALAERVGNVEKRALASWTFGQTVAEALAGIDRTRSLYDSLDEEEWNAAIRKFRTGVDGSGMDLDTRLDGEVELVVVSGVVAHAR